MKNTTTTTNAPVAKQTAHTPGPWQANPIGDTGRCSISAPHPSGGGQNVIDECLKENAALIAAAPELLAAAEKMLARWDALSVEDLGPGCRAIADTARAAIAKATKEGK